MALLSLWCRGNVQVQEQEQEDDNDIEERHDDNDSYRPSTEEPAQELYDPADNCQPGNLLYPSAVCC